MFLIGFNSRKALRERVHARALGAVATFSASVLVWGLSACSPGALSGGNTADQEVVNSRPYRKVNAACAEMDLSTNTLDVPGFRRLLACFNAYGALDPLEKLTKRLSDAELKPLVDVGNKYVLNNKPMLYQLERTYHTLGDRGVLDATLLNFGRLLENEEFVAASIAILRQSYVLQSNQTILRAIERFSKKLTSESLATGIDVGLTVAGARSFSSLERRFRGESIHGRGLRDLTNQVVDYIQDNRDPRRVEVGRELVNSLISGKMFRALDEMVGINPDQIRAGVPELASIMQVTMRSEIAPSGSVLNAPILDDLTSLFHYLNGPIYCLKRSKYVPDATMHIIRELAGQNTEEAANFLKRSNLLTLMVMNPFCEYPEALGKYYSSVIRLADTSAIEPATDLTKSLYRNGLAPLLVGALADTGSGLIGGAPENTTGIKRLLPAMSELTDRGIWNDLFFLLSMHRIEDRRAIVDFLSFIMDPSVSLDGKSIYDVMLDVVSKTDSNHVFRLIYSLRRFVGSDVPLVVPMLTALRSAYYVNDVHPVIDFVHELTSKASKHEAFFNSLFKMADMPEFEDTIRMFSDMSKDGRLQELLGSIVTLFHKFAEEGRTREILSVQEPPFVALRRHDLNASDAVSALSEQPWDERDPCRRLDTRVPMDNYLHSRFDQQLDDMLACIDLDRRHGDVVTSVNFLRHERATDGRGFLNLHIDMMKDLDVGREEMGDLADRWIRAVDNGRFYQLMDAVPYWVSRKVRGEGEPGGVAGPVLRPLLDLVKPVIRDASENLRRLMDLGARILSRQDFPSLLKYGERIIEKKPEPQPMPLRQDFDIDRIMRWVRNKECVYNPQQQLGRAQQIIYDYNNAVTSWELEPGTNHPRYKWTKTEFKGNLEPLFQKFGDPKQNAPEKSAVQGLMNVMNYFTLPSDPSFIHGPDHPQRNERQHYTPEYLARFLRERSDDYRLITYFYPGERNPRVRLVSSLDRLEMVLINADFTFMKTPYFSSGNMGFQFLAMIGEAWGDEPPHVWPEAVRKQYPAYEQYCSAFQSEADRKAKVSQKLCPQNLRDAFEQILQMLQVAENVIGFPEMPNCKQENYSDVPTEWTLNTSGVPEWVAPLWVKASVYNLRQVVAVIDENLPGSQTEHAGGIKVLRDLFYELYTSSPVDARNMYGDWRNNLSVVSRLVRMGLTRNIGKQLSKFPPIPSDPARLTPSERADYEALVEFFRSFVKGATSEQSDQLLDTLFVRSEDHQLIWKILDQIFDASDSPDGAYLRQFSFFGIAEAGKLEIITPALKTLNAVLDRYGDYLTRRADKVDAFLRSKEIAYLARALYEDRDHYSKAIVADVLRGVLNEPQNGLDAVAIMKVMDDAYGSHSGQMTPWDTFNARWRVIQSYDDYRYLNLPAFGKDVLRFMQEEHDYGQPKTAAIVRQFMARRLRSRSSGTRPGDVEEILQLIARKPDDFYQIMGMVGHYIENGELKDFVKLARRSLSAPPRSN